ncbi:MAG: GAF domain-containing sensor histidine kinase [Chloroflexi bacterium]|nr:GAF domain-containing sensor histidine kinase [Chloroflexota bacterium]
MNAERELGIVNAVAAALNSSPDVRQALEATLSLVAEMLGLRTGWVWLMDQETHHFYAAAERELPPYLQERVRMAGRRRCWCIDDFRDGELTPTNIDVIECSRLEPAFHSKSAALAAGLRYHASIPLYFQDKPLGIMNLTGPEWRKLTPDELQLLSTIAYQVGIAIERARLAEDATRLARAEERTRLAREIHDTLAQGLTAIALNIEGAMHRMDKHPDQARERLTRALAMARENLEDARRSVLDLRGGTGLDGKPLAEALNGLARAFTSDTGVPATVKAGNMGSLPLRTEMELYRIAQEALTNVRKHAHAHSVEISLRRRGAALTLSVRDDGRGFVRATRTSTTDGGQGLIGMRERARLLGGQLRISSAPERGTAVIARIPIDSADSEKTEA